MAKEITCKTADDFRKLSYFTLCCLHDTTNHNPIESLPHMIAAGRFEGVVTVDELGNFVSFR